MQLIQTNISSMYQGIKILKSVQFRKWVNSSLSSDYIDCKSSRNTKKMLSYLSSYQNTYYALQTHQQVQTFLCNLNLNLIYVTYHLLHRNIISSNLLFARFYFKILFYIKFEINSKKNRKGSGKQNQRYQINRIWWDFAVQSQHFLGIPINCRWNLITALYCRSFPR